VAQTIAAILGGARTIAVVGLSPNPQRTSHAVARYMQLRGWRILPVNPLVDQVLGETAYPTLAAAAAAEPIALVNVFRKTEELPEVVDAAIACGAPALWLQLGLRDDVAAARARRAGLRVVQDRCLMVEHSQHA